MSPRRLSSGLVPSSLKSVNFAGSVRGSRFRDKYRHTFRILRHKCRLAFEKIRKLRAATSEQRGVSSELRAASGELGANHALAVLLLFLPRIYRLRATGSQLVARGWRPISSLKSVKYL